MAGRALVAMLIVLLLALPACRGDAGRPVEDPGADSPAAAVRILTGHLRGNDFAAFARAAAPPPLYARIDAAWRAGRTTWPLDELPFGARTPQVLAALSAEDAEAALLRTFERQFAGADGALRQAAEALGLFGVQYLQGQGGFSDDERQHFTQIVGALAAWGASAPLGDRERIQTTLSLLTAAARDSGLTGAEDLAAAGLDDGLRRLAGLVAAGKQALAQYGLDLDAALAGMDVQLQSQTGETARVRMRYQLAGQTIDTVVGVERHAGRWYVSDFLRNAEAAAGQAPADTDEAPVPPAPGTPRAGA